MNQSATVFIPLCDIAAMRAARELELLQLIARKVSALRDELVRDPRFAKVIAAN